MTALFAELHLKTLPRPFVVIDAATYQQATISEVGQEPRKAGPYVDSIRDLVANAASPILGLGILMYQDDWTNHPDAQYRSSEG